MGERMNKRRRLFPIVPEKSKMKAQLRYVTLIILTQFVCITIIVLGFNSILHILLKAAQLGPYAEAQLDKVFFWMNFLFGAVTLITILVGGFLSLRISHKFFGPIYRMENIIKEALHKDKLAELNIRKNDELHELVNLLNEFFRKKGLI